MSSKVLIKIEAEERVLVSLTLKIYIEDILLMLEIPLLLLLLFTMIFSVNTSSCRCKFYKCVCFFRSSPLSEWWKILNGASFGLTFTV